MMRYIETEWYVPDVVDNRARAARGEPAIRVELRPPSARVWRRFFAAVTDSPEAAARLGTLLASDRELTRERAVAILVKRALFDDSLAAILWRACVGRVEWPEAMAPRGGPAPTSGEDLWAAMDRLDSPDLYHSILEALIDRATLEAGLIPFCGWPSGPPPSAGMMIPPDGTAATAVGGVSTS